jgi:hypothetical protein
LIENATNIEKRSFRMIWEFEGLDPDIEEWNQLKMNKAQWKAATYLAIGRWVATRVQEVSCKDIGQYSWLQCWKASSSSTLVGAWNSSW